MAAILPSSWRSKVMSMRRPPRPSLLSVRLATGGAPIDLDVAATAAIHGRRGEASERICCPPDRWRRQDVLALIENGPVLI